MDMPLLLKKHLFSDFLVGKLPQSFMALVYYENRYLSFIISKKQAITYKLML